MIDNITIKQEERAAKLLNRLDDSFILNNKLLPTIADKQRVVNYLVTVIDEDETIQDIIRLLYAGFRVEVDVFYHDLRNNYILKIMGKYNVAYPKDKIVVVHKYSTTDKITLHNPKEIVQ